MADLEEGTVSLEMRVEEAEGNLAAAQAEAETAVIELDKRVKELTTEHDEKLASTETALRAEVNFQASSILDSCALLSFDVSGSFQYYHWT